MDLAASAYTRWLPRALQLDRYAELRQDAAGKVTSACRTSGAVTVELWLRTAVAAGSGPILELGNGVQSSLALCYDRARGSGRFDLRTSERAEYQEPRAQTPPGAIHGEPRHLVFTHAASGAQQLYLDGQSLSLPASRADLSAWRSPYPLLLVNAPDETSPWLGDLYLAAVFERALDPEEVARNFAAGP